MTKKVLVNSDDLDKLLEYVYKDEKCSWRDYDPYADDMYDGSKTPANHIFWSIRQLCCDNGWFEKADVRRFKKERSPRERL